MAGGQGHEDVVVAGIRQMLLFFVPAHFTVIVYVTSKSS